MDYPLRTIHYAAEFLHPAKPHNPVDLQKIHSIVFTDAKFQYQNFQLVQGGAVLFNPPAATNTASTVTFLPDRVQIREHMTGISREDFQDRVERFSQLCLQVLGVPQFVMQHFTIQSLVNARNFYDSREFMSRSMLNMEEEDFACLQRKPQIVGVRMVFPPTQELRGLFNIRIESYAAEPRSLFIENVAVFNSVVNAQNLNDLTSNFFATYDYIDGNLIDFVAQFDGREESPPQ